ncbi:CD276 antigen isoform X2 [Latimeria chalumnae]|uniref:CD276 antigen isoform X2 n=1 Tax=Latimeria chalumnae TaxID=7897 RepID=UPI00313E8D26
MLLRTVAFLLAFRDFCAALNVNIEPSPVISDLGSDVLLHCSFTVDTPSIDFSFLIVKWFLKGVVLMEFNDKITVSRPRMKMSDTEISKGNASLSISDIRIVDEGDYICSILYTPEKIEKTVSLAVKATPKVSVFAPVISESKETDLVCSASGYHPTEITVQWLRNGQVLNDAKLSSLQRNPDNTSSISSTYTFTPTNQDKDKAYSCHVNHTALRKPIEEDILLNYVDPLFTITTDPSPISQLLGSDTLLKCLFSINSTNLNYLTVRWSQKGNLLFEFERGRTRSGNGAKVSESKIATGDASLLLPRVTATQNGEYTCFIQYGLSTGEKRVTLKVEAPPRKSALNLEMRGDHLFLECNVSHYHPEDITVTLLKGGEVLRDSKHSVPWKNDNNTFSVSSSFNFIPTERDYNEAYSCHVNHSVLQEPLHSDNWRLLRVITGGKPPVSTYVCIVLVTLILTALITTFITWLILRRCYSSVISTPWKYMLGQKVPITAVISYHFEQNITAFWLLLNCDKNYVGTEEREKLAACRDSELMKFRNNQTDHKIKRWPTQLLTSTLLYEPRIEDAGCRVICMFYRDGKEIPNTRLTTNRITVFARPEVSDIKEIPVSGEDEVKFTVDVSKFYPKEIQIHWSHNGKHLEGKTSEQHCNVNDGTYSVTNQIVIPERELKEKYQIKVTIKHESMEEPAVKEKTLQDPVPLLTFQARPQLLT